MAALKEQWARARKARQQEIVQRQQAVQETLTHYQQSRAVNAADTQAELVEYCDSIRDETSLYLTQVEQQRRATAQQTAQQLQSFDAELRAAVAEQRAVNQANMVKVAEEVAELQQATQAVLTTHQRDRVVMHDQQQQELSAYAEELKGVVADYLTEVSENRQAMAAVNQVQRHRDRETLTAEVAVYREQMHDFRANLRQSVWGDESANDTFQTETSSHQDSPSPGRAQPKAKVITSPVKPAAATKSTKNSASAAKKSSSAKPTVPIEEAVFNYLQTHREGARLTEVESTLGINRFQAVDALRSLIQKELIIQKDRTYRIQEEAIL